MKYLLPLEYFRFLAQVLLRIFLTSLIPLLAIKSLSFNRKKNGQTSSSARMLEHRSSEKEETDKEIIAIRVFEFL